MTQGTDERSLGAQYEKDHEQLLEEGRQRPGVAEAIEIFEALQQHVGRVGLQQGVSTMGYATGGNA